MMNSWLEVANALLNVKFDKINQNIVWISNLLDYLIEKNKRTYHTYSYRITHKLGKVDENKTKSKKISTKQMYFGRIFVHT